MLEILWHVVFSVSEHLIGCIGSSAVSLSEVVGSYRVHGLLEGRILFRVDFTLLVQVWIKIISLVGWLDFIVYVNEINVEGDIQEFLKLLVGLSFDVELAQLLRLMLIFVPCVALESIKQVVIRWIKIVMIEEFVRLLCRHFREEADEKAKMCFHV